MAFATLGVSLTARIRGFSRGLRTARRQLRGFARFAAGALARVRVRFAALATAGVGFLTGKLFKSVDSLGKMADRLGITTEMLATLRHQARLSGVGINQLDIGLQRMTRRIAEAAQGTGEAQDALAELGLDAGELAGMSPDEQFKAIADAMAEVKNSSDQVRLAFKLFDSEGVGLLNTLRRIEGDGFRKAQLEAKRLGIALTRDQVKAIENVNDQWTRFIALVRGFIIQLAIKYAPRMEEFGRKMRDAFKDGKSLVEDFTIAIGNLEVRLRDIVELFDKFRRQAQATQAAPGDVRAASAQLVDESVIEPLKRFWQLIRGGEFKQAFREAFTIDPGPWQRYSAELERIKRAMQGIQDITSRGELSRVFGENVVSRAEGAGRAEVLQMQRTTPGREQNIEGTLQRQLDVLQQIREKLGLGVQGPAKAG